MGDRRNSSLLASRPLPRIGKARPVRIQEYIRDGEDWTFDRYCNAKSEFLAARKNAAYSKGTETTAQPGGRGGNFLLRRPSPV